MSQIETVMSFINQIETEHPDVTPYYIANLLRGYTKPRYCNQLWTAATGQEQKYITGQNQGKLNQENLILGDEITDFGHFIASLSDQINQPGLNWSDLTGWSSDHTSWAGDIGSAIMLYHSEIKVGANFSSLTEALNRLASDPDYTADIAAFIVGDLINTKISHSVYDAIDLYETIPYRDHVRTFIKKRFNGIIQNDELKNPAEIDSIIRKSVMIFLVLYPVSYIVDSVKKLINFKPEFDWQKIFIPNNDEILIGSLHFMNHLVTKAQLKPIQFRPYRVPALSVLGTLEPVEINP